MKRQFILSLILFGCSPSLKQSNFDQSMRVQGTYVCPRVIANTDANRNRISQETIAEADVARIRCYQDQWRVEGSDLSLTRQYFQTEHCENPLGRVEFEKKTNSSAHCSFVRSNPAWVAEDKGVCLFKDLKPNERYSVAPMQKCARNLPVTCFHPESEISIDAPSDGNREISTEITLKSGHGYQATCKRYQQ